ncbi:MAG: hypothetical protein KJ058_03700 [Thermoanaerobaculia bacterium]|nr:hypothetical protein [Thermoanaerobaculia bacterium]
MFTILMSPLLAVQVTEALQKRKEGRARRGWIFKTLMATRASRLHIDHVHALNMIDIEFRGKDKKSKAVVEAWKVYLAHLNTKGTSPDVWSSRGDDLFIDLLFVMARCLGYGHERSDIKSTSYFPMAHGKLEDENARIRLGLVELLEGKRSIPIAPPAPRP